METDLENILINVIRDVSFLIHIYSVLASWKKQKHIWKNHGKFMEFDSGIRLETLC